MKRHGKSIRHIGRALSTLMMLSVLMACNERVVFHQYRPVSPSGWAKTDTLTFTTEIADSLLPLSVGLEVRVLEKYAYRHLKLGVSYYLPSGELISESTVTYDLLNERNQWSGEGIAGLHSYKTEAPSLPLQEAGTYKISVIPQMQDSLLQGVYDVGIRLEKGTR